MALIRGFGGKCPCPICLVPDTQLSNLSERFELRTTETMQALVVSANSQDKVADGEEILKAAGLRKIDVRVESPCFIFTR